MKHIVKNAEPAELIVWKAMATADWQPSYADLSGAEKAAVKNALMKEQGYICCYCERRLTDNDSHIEHFRPQHDPAVDPLDYGNMLCSCQKQLEKGEPRHCGNLKGAWFDEQLLVSPLDPTCGSRFRYTADGGIRHADDTDIAAKSTIERLGLALPKLNAMRKKAVEPFLDEELSADEVKRFASGYLSLNQQGMLGEFWSAINFLFGEQTPP